MKLNDTSYYPTNFNFHIPSENTVDGVHYSAELQINHTNTDGELAVLGVFFNYNATLTPAATENVFVKSLFDSYDATVKTDIAFADFITSLNFTAHW